MFIFLTSVKNLLVLKVVHFWTWKSFEKIDVLCSEMCLKK